MILSDNTILITGGGSGIGRALAERLHVRGNRVIIAGRDAARLAAVAGRHPGMGFYALDVADPRSVREFAEALLGEWPDLNVLINNAGIMRAESLLDGSTDVAEATVVTNLLGPIRLTAALLPHLMTRGRAAVINVTSGLAFVPTARAPTYCATKAALHSFSQTLRVQLRGTPVQVIEIVPPYVQTELQGPAQASDPNAMPLDAFADEALRRLEADPDAEEVLVERVLFQRRAESEGRYEAAFRRINGL